MAYRGNPDDGVLSTSPATSSTPSYFDKNAPQRFDIERPVRAYADTMRVRVNVEAHCSNGNDSTKTHYNNNNY
jgi:hypothetical protein